MDHPNLWVKLGDDSLSGYSVHEQIRMLEHDWDIEAQNLKMVHDYIEKLKEA